MSSRKRKNQEYKVSKSYEYSSFHEDATKDPDPSLFIHAHEADIVRGAQARVATSLELRSNTMELRGLDPSHIGSALIRWGEDDSRLDVHSNSSAEIGQNKVDIWVDRYDARLLLDQLPEPQTSPLSAPLSPGGWSDLPSDSEDTFFFTPDEVEDFRREKRRRLIDQSREERLRALREEEGSDEDEETWCSNEEPDEQQAEIMAKTARHILSSPNPAQLEMRILANHGVDARFAFLRGRWSRRWRIVKQKVKLEKEAAPSSSNPTLGGLVTYDDSDEEEDDNAEAGSQDKPDNASAEEAAKEARRARAREWSARRRDLLTAERQDTK